MSNTPLWPLHPLQVPVLTALDDEGRINKINPFVPMVSHHSSRNPNSDTVPEYNLTVKEKIGIKKCALIFPSGAFLTDAGRHGLFQNIEAGSSYRSVFKKMKATSP